MYFLERNCSGQAAYFVVAFADRTYQPLNLRGRCSFGFPCDENNISYGCETFNNKVGICWSECAGYLPSSYGSGGGFNYEGWCYNMNTRDVFNIGIGKSGKDARFKSLARVSRDVDWDDEQSIKDYFDAVSSFLFTT